MLNFKIGSNADTYPISRSNIISKSYYYLLVGEINRGYNLQYKAVAKVEDKGYITYHDISVR